MHIIKNGINSYIKVGNCFKTHMQKFSKLQSRM